MTSPYVFSDEATQSVLEILTSSSDQHDAHLDAATLPAVAGPPPLAAELQGGAMAFVPGYYNTVPSAPSPGYYNTPSGPPSPGYYNTPGAPPASGGQAPGAPNAPYAISPYAVSPYGAGYKPFIGAGPGGQAPGAPAAAPAGPYVFPAQQPKPGELRILKSLESGYKKQNEEALSELEKRDVLKLPKSSKVVRYLNDQKREKYRVKIGTVITRGDAPFDTKRTKAKYLANGKAGGFMMDYLTQAQTYEWGLNGLIWVCVGSASGTEKPSFFSHVGKPDRFHHSSFNRGQGVICAGEWIIKEGALIKVSATSGHYHPTIDNLYHAVLQMAVAFRDQATTGATTVFLFDKQTFTWIDYPVKEFIKSPTGGGRYAVHPSG
ncbi:MAG TPA: hypothetical protein VGM67_18395 [Gemmatimonadaceae bacterium]|jgi:hypothetical protein